MHVHFFVLTCAFSFQLRMFILVSFQGVSFWFIFIWVSSSEVCDCPNRLLTETWDGLCLLKIYVLSIQKNDKVNVTKDLVSWSSIAVAKASIIPTKSTVGFPLSFAITPPVRTYLLIPNTFHQAVTTLQENLQSLNDITPKEEMQEYAFCIVTFNGSQWMAQKMQIGRASQVTQKAFGSYRLWFVLFPDNLFSIRYM